MEKLDKPATHARPSPIRHPTTSTAPNQDQHRHGSTDRGLASAAQYERELISARTKATSGAKSDAGDAHVLAKIVRLDRDHHRLITGDTDLAEAVKLVVRAHQTAIWERTRHVLRLRSNLLQYFPAAVEAL